MPALLSAIDIEIERQVNSLGEPDAFARDAGRFSPCL